MAEDQAFVTLATNDNYARGAMVLGKSLRNHQTTRKLVVMIGPHVSDPCKFSLGGDQGILNGFFSNWATADISKHLPFIYNLSSIAIYTYLPAFKQYGGNAKVVHFLGQTKPWSYTYDPKTKRVSGDMQETSTHTSFLLDWWFLYSSSVVPMMVEGYGDQPFHSGCVEVHLEGSSLSHDSRHTEPYMSPETSEERKQKWEQGQADYMGMDSFDNIQKKLDAFLK
nr:glycogenin-1-like [Oncorhynchus nerka]